MVLVKSMLVLPKVPTEERLKWGCRGEAVMTSRSGELAESSSTAS